MLSTKQTKTRSTMFAPMVHEIAGAAARERPHRGHKPVTIRECEAHARLALAPAGSCKR
jgi:hypothetical protein